MDSCKNILYTFSDIPETLECREMKPSKQADRMLQALKKEFLPHYEREFNGYLRSYFETENESDKEQILANINSIYRNYPDHIHFIEMIGYFAWKRFRFEHDSSLLISTTHKVRELTQRKVPRWWEFVGLQDDFYGYLRMELEKDHSPIDSILPNILIILWNDFKTWLTQAIRIEKNLNTEKKQAILSRYNLYRNKS